MAIGIYFRPASMSADKYDETIRRLEAAGAGAPAGRSYHVCFGEGDPLYERYHDEEWTSGTPRRRSTSSARP